MTMQKITIQNIVFISYFVTSGGASNSWIFFAHKTSDVLLILLKYTRQKKKNSIVFFSLILFIINVLFSTEYPFHVSYAWYDDFICFLLSE